jgi:hypothetical protein
LIDFDQDGEISALDLLKAFERVSLDSKFGLELKKLINWYTERNIQTEEVNMVDPSKANKKFVQNIDMGVYISLMPIQGSSIVTELSKRVMAHP